MKQIALPVIGLLLLGSPVCSLYAQSRPISGHIYFDKAYYTIRNMLEGKEPVNFKKAVFFTENAYLGGALRWEDFDRAIRDAVPLFRDMIARSGFQKFRTAKNWAVHMYMVDTTVTSNRYQRFNYNYESYANDTIGLVSNLLKRIWVTVTRCHSSTRFIVMRLVPKPF